MVYIPPDRHHQLTRPWSGGSNNAWHASELDFNISFKPSKKKHNEESQNNATKYVDFLDIPKKIEKEGAVYICTMLKILCVYI